MKKKIYLHVGTHKTGSTAIQRTLESHKVGLQNENVGLLRLPNNELYHKLMYFTEVDNAASQKIRNSLLRQISEHNNCKSFILSYELFSGNPNTLYSNQEVVLEIIKNALYDFELELIVFFRRQDEFIQSLYMQLIHEGKDISIDVFLQMPSTKIDYLNFIDGLIKVFGESKLNVFPYDSKVLTNRDIIQLFNLPIKSKTLEQLESKNINVGFSSHGKELFERLRKDLTREGSRHLRFLIQENSNKGVLNEYNILSYAQKKNFLERFEKTNAILAERFWLERFDLKNFSSINKSDCTMSKKEANKELSDVIITKLLSDVKKKASKEVNIEPTKEELLKIFIRKIKRKVNGGR